VQMLHALAELEGELKMLRLWSVQAPGAIQMASVQPFCIDTMSFEQWLQWIFIPRMKSMAEQGLTTLGPCQISPMGEQSFLHLGRRNADLLRILARIDRLAAAD